MPVLHLLLNLENEDTLKVIHLPVLWHNHCLPDPKSDRPWHVLFELWILLQHHRSAPVGVRMVCLLRLYIYILATVFVPPVDINTLLAKILHCCSALKTTVNISVTLNCHYGCLRLKISMILLRLVRRKFMLIPSRFFKRYQYLLSSLVAVLGGVVVLFISVSRSVAVPSQWAFPFINALSFPKKGWS